MKIKDSSSTTLIVVNKNFRNDVEGILDIVGLDYDDFIHRDLSDYDVPDILFLNNEEFSKTYVIKKLNKERYFINNIIIYNDTFLRHLDTEEDCNLMLFARGLDNILYISNIVDNKVTPKEIFYYNCISNPDRVYTSALTNNIAKNLGEYVKCPWGEITVRFKNNFNIPPNLNCSYVDLKSDRKCGLKQLYSSVYNTVISEESNSSPLVYIEDLSRINELKEVYSNTFIVGEDTNNVDNPIMVTDDLSGKSEYFNDIIFLDIPNTVGILFEDCNPEKILFITYVFSNRLKEIEMFPIYNSYEHKAILSLVVG